MADPKEGSEGSERSPSGGREVSVGDQTLRSEPGGILHIILRGNYGEHETERVTSTIDELVAETGSPYFLMDIRELKSISFEARRASADWVRRQPVIGAMAIAGATQYFRVIASLLLRAAALLGAVPYPLQFFQDDEEARAWLREQRAKAT